MADIPSTFLGTVHGNKIELNQTPGLPDGQSVSVTLHPVSSVRDDSKLRAAFGAWSDDAGELDQFLEETRKQRQVENRDIER